MLRMVRGGGIFEENDEGIGGKIQSGPKFVTFESPQSASLTASLPLLWPFGPHFPLIGGIGPLSPRGALVQV